MDLFFQTLANYGVLGLWLVWQLYREKTFMARMTQVMTKLEKRL